MATDSVPLVVIRRELSRVVPQCCGLVWNAVRELVELNCRGRQWTLPYNLGPGDAEDRLYEIKLATAFVMVTLCLYALALLHR